MQKKLAPCLLMAVIFTACGNSDIPPWLRDANTGGDVAGDAIVGQDTPHDAPTDANRELPGDITGEVGFDALADIGREVADDAVVDADVSDAGDAIGDIPYPDTTPDVTDAGDAGGDAAIDVKADVPPDVIPDTTTDTAADAVSDTAVDAGWECERDDDCDEPANLGVCETMKCLDHLCVRQNLPDLQECDDNSLCTTEDRCADGICTGNPLICNDNNVCTNDYCNPYTGCTTSAKNNVPCEDGNPCTVNDRCNAKVCQPGATMTCNTPPAAACASSGSAVETWTGPGYCSGGSCVYQKTSTPCPEGCLDGECVSNPCFGVECDTPPGPCYKPIGTCNMGDCTYQFDNTAACSDGNPCTNDTCNQGTCQSLPVICDNPPPKKCDDDGMTLVVYDSVGACTDGQCVYGTSPLVCEDGCVNNACVDDPCAGVDCTTAGSPCLKSPGQCVNGECVFEPDNAAACSDGDACTIGDHCGAGTCVPGAPADCDDNNECTDDSCDPMDGCSNDANTVMCRPAFCSGSVFSPASYCADKNCQVEEDQECEDGEFCTNDWCDDAQGCVRTFSTATCDDGEPCTSGDTCQGGSCHGVPVQCETPPTDYCSDEMTVVRYSADGQCRADGACEYASTSYDCDFGCEDGKCLGDPCEGVNCQNPPNSCYVGPGICSNGECIYGFANGTECDSDASVCTLESCLNGACTVDATMNCDLGNHCIDYACEPVEGCKETPNVDTCDDGDPCSTNDVCGAGICAGTPMTCNDNNACTYDGCVGGTCEFDPIDGCCTNNLMCDDEDPCTMDECDTGARICSHERFPGCCAGDADCDDQNPCTDDQCFLASCRHMLRWAEPACCQAPESINPDTGLPWASPDERAAFADAQCDHLAPCYAEYACDLTTNGCRTISERTEGCCLEDSDCLQNTACVANEACVDNACTWDLLTPDCCVTEGDCDDRPLDWCDADTAVNYSPGTCDAHTCNYVETRTPCQFGCLLGECLPDPCAGVVCDTPPGICRETNGECVNGTCVYDPVDGIPCDLDSSVCTPDTCSGGQCTAAWPIDCNDHVDCTVDGCNPVSGCYHNANNAACPDDGNECTSVMCDLDEGCVVTYPSQPCSDDNECTTGDTCSGGTCSGTPVNCGTDTECTDFSCDPETGCSEDWLTGSCDDGDPCTIGDACLFGTCGAAGNMNCNDGNSCTADQCVGGVCTHVKAANLSPCDDANPCTSDDKCYNGYCSGTGLYCDDEDPCTTDTCNLDTMTCLYPFNNNACDDNSKCTVNDQCSLGSCAGTAIDCDDGNECTDDSCNPATGCVNDPNSAACEDGNACTENDICVARACTSGGTRVCDDNNECTTDSCDPASGCVYVPIGGGCDDGDPCTYGDSCNNRVCQGVTITCEPALACTTAECDGTDRCVEGVMAGWCVIDGQCVAENATPPGNHCKYCNPGIDLYQWTFDDGVICDDAEPCTVGDVCLGGTCSGEAYDCNDGLACTADTCDGAGDCSHVPGTGWCAIEGACRSEGDPNPVNECEHCAAGIDPMAWTDREGPCEDGDECTVSDSCSAGVCTAGSAKNCDDGNPCTDNLCESDREGGCYNPAIVAICAAARCDGLIWSAPAMCSGTTCPAQTTTNCDDGNACTDDLCTVAGCTHTANDAFCDDSNPCTSGDRCSNRVCSGTPYSCTPSDECVLSSICDGNGTCTEIPKDSGIPCSTDNNPCTDDECDGSGLCRHPAVTDGQPCDDNNVCTTGGTCLDGSCSDGNDVECQPIDQCHVAGVCNPLTGECSNPPAQDGTWCDDGNPCTIDDACSDGVCVGPTVNPCTPLDDCHGAGSCNPSTGLCTWPALADGTGCNDDNLCTTRDVCSKGVCKGLDPLSCAPVDTCHYTGTCAPETGLCTWPERPDGTVCNDSNACTTGTTCTDGVCGGGTQKTCPAINNCHLDGECNTSTGVCTAPIRDDGSPCTDSSPCTTGDQCLAGTCTGTSYSCSDGKSCTTDTCNGDGTCSFPVNAGWCLIEDYCRSEGQTNPANPCQICHHDLLDGDWSSNDGAACNDYRLDTMNDVCVGSTCAGTPYNCDDGLDCTEDICDGAGNATHNLTSGYCLIDGACWTNHETNPLNACQKCSVASSTTVWTPSGNGIACNDADACTYNDKCQAGVCQGTSYSCDDGLDCTINTCNGNGNCGGSVVEGYCMIWNACVAQSEGNPVNACQHCDPSSSQIGWSPANEGQPCDDNNPNTSGDICVGGDCIGEGMSCVDGLECTDDLVVGGFCQNPLKSGWCHIDGVCVFNGNLNNENRCQICNATASQTAWSANDGVACSDNDACTLDDICSNQVCGGTTITCNDNVACTTDACVNGNCEFTVSDGWCLIAGGCVAADTVNPANGCEKCDPNLLKVNWVSNEGSTCDDDDFCTHDDACVSKVCRGVGYSCNDGLACTTDSCNGLGGCDRSVDTGWCLIDGNCVAQDTTNPFNVCQVCDHAASETGWSDNAGASCNDGNICTWPDTCAGGSCSGTPAACDDGLVCTADFCDGVGGCLTPVLLGGWCLIDGVCHSNRQVNPDNPCLVCKPEIAHDAWAYRDGVVCEDGNGCTVFDTCSEGVCGGTAYSCDDGLACTTDVCDGVGGCDSSTILPDTCVIEGACRNPDDVSATDSCQGCNPALSQTAWSVMVGNPCSDGNACTTGDTCDSAGVCGGENHPCDDGLICTDNVCDGAGGCDYPVSQDWCLINAECLTAGAEHPTEICMVCAPTINHTDWTTQDPGIEEVCNGVDDNCDGVTDPENVPGCQNYYIDADNDGAGTGTAFRCLCAPDGNFRSLLNIDCDDTNGEIYPGNAETCDGIDNNCDEVIDDQNSIGCTEYYYDYDRDSFGQPGTIRCLCATEGYYDALQDGDCNDASIGVNPAQAEVCDGLDNDCDGLVDPDGTTGCTIMYKDEDGDTFGSGPAICMCVPRGVYNLTSDGDCDDTNNLINPTGTELCNGLDDDCDGTTDNADVAAVCPLDSGYQPNGTPVCTDGQCELACDPRIEDPLEYPWHNTDGYYGNGCECQGDLYDGVSGDTCATATDLGSFSDSGTSLVIAGNLPRDGAEDWYKVTFTDPTWNSEPGGADLFHARVSLDIASSSEYEIALMENCSGDMTCSAAIEFDWAVDFTSDELGENPCALRGNNCQDGNPTDYAQCLAITGDAERCNSCPALPSPDYHLCSDNSRTLLIRVKRHEGMSQSCAPYNLTISNGPVGG